MSDPIEIVCLGCGCLCDDYPARVVNGVAVPADATCPRGTAWLAAGSHDGFGPAATRQGQPIDPDEAVNLAADWLRTSRAPWIVGLTGSTVETVREAAALADRLGAVIERGDGLDASAELAALREVGQVTATLGEVRDRADLIVYWNADPDKTHPRHGQRYAIDPVGRFIPDGRKGRIILVAGQSPNTTAQRADDFLEVPPNADFRYLQALRGLVRFGAWADVPDPALIRWAEALRSARYAAIFHDGSMAEPAAVEALFLLVRESNDSQRSVVLAMGGPGNPAGASAVLTWQGGDPLGLDFSAGHPRSLPVSRPESGTTPHDVVLIVGGDPIPTISETATTIRIGPGSTRTGPTPSLAIQAARPGVDGPGTVVRCDGAWLRLVPPLPARHPTERTWLRRIRRRLDELSP